MPVISVLPLKVEDAREALRVVASVVELSIWIVELAVTTIPMVVVGVRYAVVPCVTLQSLKYAPMKPSEEVAASA